MVRSFLQFCNDINCPVSDEKTKWACVTVTFLGILINGVHHMFCIPEDKKEKAINLLKWAVEKKKVIIKFIQRLTGTLNFLNKALVPGHAFTKGMYGKLRVRDKSGNLLKQHHHV